MPVKEHPDAHEEEDREGVLKRNRLGRGAVRKAALAHHHAGEEGAEREAHVKDRGRGVGDAERRRLMAFVAPSKTWNVPGLGCAFAIVPDPTLRAHFTRDYDNLIPCINLFGWVGAEAAYRFGEPWRLGLLAYLRRNRALLEEAVRAWGLPLCRLQATYLGFLDCTALAPKLNGESPHDFFLRVAKVALNDGAVFGAPGWVRINIATQTATLRAALERMGNALATLR